MALYPPALRKLIPPGPNDPRVDVMVGTVAHVAVSLADSLHDFFEDRSGGVESHFYIRLSGVVEQYRDTAYEADAQGAGNSWLVGSKRYGFISYETEGMGSGEWTPEQLAAIKELILWGRAVHGYPMVKATGYRGYGHGYHRLFDEWNPSNHSCPGDDRVKQFNNILVPWLATGAPAKDWFDMATQADLKAALMDPDVARNMARFVATGFTWAGPDGVDRVLAGHLSVIDGLARVAIKAASEDLTPDQVRAAVADALDAKYEATVTLTPKES